MKNILFNEGIKPENSNEETTWKGFILGTFEFCLVWVGVPSFYRSLRLNYQLGTETASRSSLTMLDGLIITFKILMNNKHKHFWFSGELWLSFKPS